MKNLDNYCRFCDTCFQTRDELILHRFDDKCNPTMRGETVPRYAEMEKKIPESKYKGKGRWSKACGICEVCGSDTTNLPGHVPYCRGVRIVNRNDKGEISCAICGMKCKSDLGAVSHWDKTHGPHATAMPKVLTTCDICGIESLQPKEHLKRCPGIKIVEKVGDMYRCAFCDLEGPSNFNMMRHYISLHKNAPKKIVPAEFLIERSKQYVIDWTETGLKISEVKKDE